MLIPCQRILHGYTQQEGINRLPPPAPGRKRFVTPVFVIVPPPPPRSHFSRDGQVEEGICQLVALLWLHHLAGGDTGAGTAADEVAGRGDRRRGGGAGAGRRRFADNASPPSNEELREFFAHQIKTDMSTVYGDGFRKAKRAYDVLGLHMLLDHVKRHHSFPAL